MTLFDQVLVHLFVDHVSRQIDKREMREAAEAAAKKAPAPAAVKGLVGSHRARARRAALLSRLPA